MAPPIDGEDIISGHSEDLVPDRSGHGHYRATDQDCEDTAEENKHTEEGMLCLTSVSIIRFLNS